MQTQQIYHLRRVDHSRNMARFYRMSLAPSLFGDVCLVRAWGRIGTRGRERIELFETSGEATSAMAKLFAIKSKRGYAASGS